MDKIILGILMLMRLTTYEIRNIIRQNYNAMCSDSLGSIQVALKKLLQAGFVTCSEFVENGVNKKRYSIMDSGRTIFMDWLKTPVDMSKTKNMDLGQLVLMGLVPATQQTDMNINLEGIRYFEYKTLQFGIAEAKFRIEWFSRLRDTVSKGEGSHE